MKNGIDVFFEDTDEQFIDLPKSVLVLKVREEGNFDFGRGKWIYGRNTGYEIGEKG